MVGFKPIPRDLPIFSFHQVVLILATLVASWLGMQAVHEFGHVLGAWLTGGVVANVVLHPFTISRTDLSTNPAPLVVVWAGPAMGVLLPLGFWAMTSLVYRPISFLFRFFAGFCLVANGLYISMGSFDHVGDCGVMLRSGSPIWLLWAFGIVTVPPGFWLWHRQGRAFGLGDARGNVDHVAVYTACLLCLALLIHGFLIGGE